MGIHLLCCSHGNKCTCIHDVVRDTFAIIVRNASFHMGRKKLRVFLSPMFNSFRQRIDIVFTKDDICTLTNVVIVHPTRTNLLLQFCAIQGFIAFNVIQAKKKSYRN
jgi:hypothetical protein